MGNGNVFNMKIVLNMGVHNWSFHCISQNKKWAWHTDNIIIENEII